VSLHRPGSDLHQNQKPFHRDPPLSRGPSAIMWPPLHVGSSSATWSLRRPPELEATKRHPVGHLELQHP
jgi:hypothetical protein